MGASEYDESVVGLRFRHYQQRVMDRINKVLQERKNIKSRGIGKEMQSRAAQSHSALPTIKHKRRDMGGNQTAQS